jgi:virulence-associated protein VagC
MVPEERLELSRAEARRILRPLGHSDLIVSTEIGEGDGCWMTFNSLLQEPIF